MSNSLSRVPEPKRRQLAATLGLFAMLFVAIGAVAATGATTALDTFAAVALVVAVLLALMAWGVVRSIKLDRAGSGLDAAIEQAVRARGGSMCDCGHDHDPTELHITDADPTNGEPAEPASSATAESCAHDGTGATCSHSCESCVLTSMRAARPSPRPRPRPMPSPR